MTAPVTEPKPKNWLQRAWSPEPTLGHLIFDFAFGVVAPLLCLYFDPGLFRSNDPCFGPLLGGTGPFVYVAIGSGTFLLAIWLIANRWITKGRSLFAGAFLGGTIFAFLLGLAMLPFSLIGLLLFGLGALGVMPFLVALVYWRNARMAWSEVGAVNNTLRFALAIAGFVFVFGLPTLTTQYAPGIFSGIVFSNTRPCPASSD